MLWFRKIPLAKMFMDKKWGGVLSFSVEIFCLAVPKNDKREPFNLSLISGIKKFYIRGLGEKFQVFPSKILSQSAGKLRRASL